MSKSPQTFDELVAPMERQQFLDDCFDRRWLHQKGAPNRFQELMSRDLLNQILSMNIWSGRTLELSLDGQKVPQQAYCDPAMGRDHQQTMVPNPQKVMQLAERGASLVLNEVETLHGPVRAIVGAIESTLGAKASANVYCSWRDHQAFQSHFDRHDVFALQVTGEKRWNIYRGRADNPIEHALFYNIPQETYDRMKGPVHQQVIMRPGDLLYLPRGQFHDAMTTDRWSIHVTISASPPNGLDWLTFLWNQAVTSSEFRTYLPRADATDDGQALAAHLRKLLTELERLALSPEAVGEITDMRRRYGMLPPEYDLHGPSKRD